MTVLKKVCRPVCMPCVYPVTSWPGGISPYYFDFTGYRDLISSTALPAANYEGVHYNLHGSVLKTYTKDEYVRDAQGRILTFGAYSQLCLYSENPKQWLAVGATITDGLDPDIGPFNATRIISAGNVENNANIWVSTTSGAPTGKQYIRLYYNAGSSNSIRFQFRDTTAGNLYVYGTIGEIPTVEVDATKVVVTFVSDELDASLGCRVMVLIVSWANPANTLILRVGPNSATAGQYIILYGADVFGHATGDLTTWRPHVPSSGSVVSVSSTQYDYNAGSPRGLFFAMSDIPLAATALAADGQIEYRGTPLFNAADTAADGKIITVNETSTLLGHDVAGFELKDGTVANNLICPATFGAELITNGDCASTTGWLSTAGGVITTVGGRIRCTNPVGDGYGKVYQAVSTIIGQSYTYGFRWYSGTMADGKMSFRAGTTLAGTDVISSTELLADGIKVFSATYKFTALSTTTYFTFGPYSSQVAGEYVEIDDVSIKQITTNYTKDTEYLIKVPYGDNAGTDQMKLMVNGTASGIGAFDGGFNPGTHLGIGGSAFPMAHSSLKIRKKAQW